MAFHFVSGAGLLKQQKVRQILERYRADGKISHQASLWLVTAIATFVALRMTAESPGRKGVHITSNGRWGGRRGCGPGRGFRRHSTCNRHSRWSLVRRSPICHSALLHTPRLAPGTQSTPESGQHHRMSHDLTQPHDSGILAGSEFT